MFDKNQYSGQIPRKKFLKDTALCMLGASILPSKISSLFNMLPPNPQK